MLKLLRSFPVIVGLVATPISAVPASPTGKERILTIPGPIAVEGGYSGVSLTVTCRGADPINIRATLRAEDAYGTPIGVPISLALDFNEISRLLSQNRENPIGHISPQGQQDDRRKAAVNSVLREAGAACNGDLIIR